ncbi:hypothetical protein [Marinomonas sp. BSi20584]|uniref:hypothetical protein n=1 Tax=Marinomonas sp. BSi20584 TaxID=1594462 RepID=UPI000C1F0B3A|nr:hypothetical protein [Marinomonas sp. BSi20584]PJE55628.1 hypothetical protein TY87_09180 [Marinomonas sp. BSi20584]
MTTKDTNTIIRAMNNVDFMDFVESHDKNGRLEKACEAFFTEYHRTDAAANLTAISEQHLISIWRFFVAYMLGFAPYGFQMDAAFDNGCRQPWETDGLKKLITEQHELAISQFA